MLTTHLLLKCQFTLTIKSSLPSFLVTLPYRLNSETVNRISEDQIKEKGNFENFNIKQETVNQLRKMGISYLFPIQSETYELIHSGADVIGKDRTGSGKTLAFSLPILEKLRSQNSFIGKTGQTPLVLIIVPTRELCVQVTNEFIRFKNSPNEFRIVSVYGGISSFFQTSQLKRGAEVLVGTPGRLIDLLQNKHINLSQIKHVILDETDTMLDIGFKTQIEDIFNYILNDINTLNRKMEDIQYLLFSATMPPFVKILASKFMKSDLVFVDMTKNARVKIPQTVKHFSYHIDGGQEQIDRLIEIIKFYCNENKNVLVFTETKKQADEIYEAVKQFVNSGILHGDISQDSREKTLNYYRKGLLKCLIATNVASRGLDIPEINLVLQIGPPQDVDTYIHRSGRTGRAGRDGTAITIVNSLNKSKLYEIEKKAGINFIDFMNSEEQVQMKQNAKKNVTNSDSKPSVKIFSFDMANRKSDKYKENKNSRSHWEDSQKFQSSKITKSLLTGEENWKTIVIRSSATSLDKQTFVDILKNNLPLNTSNGILDKLDQAKLLATNDGIVFDIRSNAFDQFYQYFFEGDKKPYFLTIPHTLPDLKDSIPSAEQMRFERTASRGIETGSMAYQELTISPLPPHFEKKDVLELLKKYKIEFVELYVPKHPGKYNSKFSILKFNDKASSESAKKLLANLEVDNKKLQISESQNTSN